MHICLVIDAKLPIGLYGGNERVAFSLGRSLFEMGHRITYLAQPSLIPFANTIIFDKTRSIESQIPKDVDLVHLHSDFPILENIPSCKTIHGNTREEKNFHPNSIFVSKSHAQNHNAKVFVYNGIDERDYGSVNFSSERNAFVFLGNASWRVKNIKGSIQVAKLANSKINILGGSRFNLKKGFRFTFSSYARFHGMVNDKVKSNFLNQARGLIFPVLWPEPFGLAIIESFYFGIPVFGTPYGSLSELVTQKTGFLSSSASELAKAASKWKYYERSAIHNYWKNNFTAKIMATNYLKYYEIILSGKTLHEGAIQSKSTRKIDFLPWNP